MADGLRVLKATGRKLVALSNSSRTLVDQQLTGASLCPFFDEVLSVETLATYKPDLAPSPDLVVDNLRQLAATFEI